MTPWHDLWTNEHCRKRNTKPASLLYILAIADVKLKTCLSNSADMMSLYRRRYLGRALSAKEGDIYASRKRWKAAFNRRDGEAKNSIRTLLYTSYLHGFISRLARLPCRRVFCFRTTSSEMSKQDWHWPYESVLHRYDTNASCNTQKMHWKKPKHLAKGDVSAVQSWHIKNIDPEIPK